MFDSTRVKTLLCGPPARKPGDKDPIHITYLKTIISQVDKRRGPGEKIHVLDVGCGQGVLADALEDSIKPHCRYVGLDRDAKAIRKLESRRRCQQVPFAPEYHATAVDAFRDVPGGFDIVVACNLLHEITPFGVSSFLSELVRHATRPDSLVVIIDMERLPSAEPEARGIVWTRAELEELVVAAGARITTAATGRREVPSFLVAFSPDLRVFDVEGARPVEHAVMHRHFCASVGSANEALDSIVNDDGPATAEGVMTLLEAAVRANYIAGQRPWPCEHPGPCQYRLGDARSPTGVPLASGSSRP